MDSISKVVFSSPIYIYDPKIHVDDNEIVAFHSKRNRWEYVNTTVSLSKDHKKMAVTCDACRDIGSLLDGEDRCHPCRINTQIVHTLLRKIEQHENKIDNLKTKLESEASN